MKINLAEQKFQELSSDFFQQYRELEELCITGSKVTILLPEIGQIYNLKKLEIKSNQITTLLSAILIFYNLQELHIVQNNFRNFTSEIR